MQLTRYSDFSLRVLIYLAVRPDQLATIEEISDATDAGSAASAVCWRSARAGPR